MKRDMKDYKDIDEYLQNFAAPSQKILQDIRETIAKAAPGAIEKISYGIPTFTLNGKNLVHFAGYEHHIGFYPGARAIPEFSEELKSYNTSKGTIQFPIDKPMPLDLITKITKFCVKQKLK